MLLALAWQDHAVIVAYLAGMIAFGVYLSRRQSSDEEYFLAGRQMPWFAVGMSVIASLLSSLTYLSEPGEVWKSGVTHIFGKMLAIPFEMLIVWVFCIPFMMRFRYTSAYEYLGHRFGQTTRRIGACLFVTMVVLWMGFVVLLSAKALARVSDLQVPTMMIAVFERAGISDAAASAQLLIVIVTVGIVATSYTMLGGLRAVIWTDVAQVVLLIGGGVFTIGFIAVTTGTWLPDWYQATSIHLTRTATTHALPLFSFDPFVRATVVTVAFNMCIWHVCTHVGNQMTVQRYFSTSDVKSARRSFVTGSLFGVGINLMLVVVGLAVLYFYAGQDIAIDRGLSSTKEQSLIFPTFAVSRLPAGCGGAILAALLAAAMSSIDSGINSIATVLTTEQHSVPERSHVGRAKTITLVAGLLITIAAYCLSFLPDKWGVVDAMPRTFNAITAPLGGLFLVGMFLPRVGEKAVIAGVVAGLATSICLGYFEQLAPILAMLGWATSDRTLSFTWIMPCSLSVTFVASLAASFIEGPNTARRDGLTWQTRDVKPNQKSCQ
ncbi:MAG: sodium/solute symporter [Planctomycetaceae bacterium]|nr:sodium/solute symporter [Planctomycetales bacterium]MCB9925132.1 sodium/solute symporter [Planctomycetaceae bacterium]